MGSPSDVPVPWQLQTQLSLGVILASPLGRPWRGARWLGGAIRGVTHGEVMASHGEVMVKSWRELTMAAMVKNGEATWCLERSKKIANNTLETHCE